MQAARGGGSLQGWFGTTGGGWRLFVSEALFRLGGFFDIALPLLSALVPRAPGVCAPMHITFVFFSRVLFSSSLHTCCLCVCACWDFLNEISDIWQKWGCDI